MKFYQVDTDDYAIPRGGIIVVLSPGYTPETLFALAQRLKSSSWGYADVGDPLPPCHLTTDPSRTPS